MRDERDILMAQLWESQHETKALKKTLTLEQLPSAENPFIKTNELVSQTSPEPESDEDQQASEDSDEVDSIPVKDTENVDYFNEWVNSFK